MVWLSRTQEVPAPGLLPAYMDATESGRSSVSMSEYAEALVKYKASGLEKRLTLCVIDDALALPCA